jgi:GNAT superfamily N-acetyltransferase
MQTQPEVDIQLATEDDIPGIQLAAAESWRAAYSGVFTSDFIEAFVGRAYSTESLRRVLHSTRSVFVVARYEGDVVGFAHGGFSVPAEGERRGQLYRIYLRPAWWGSGVGELLLRPVEAWLREEGYGGYGCFVHRANVVGRRFYEKQGFHPVPAHDDGDHLFLWKDLP